MRPAVHLEEEVGTRLGFRAVLLRCLPLAGVLLVAAAQPRTPEAALAELMNADRTFGFLGEVTGAMAPEVTVPMPGRGLVEGLVAVRAEWMRDTLDGRATVKWSPIGGGLSADGLHGFTYGYSTARRSDGTAVAGKYLAYWVKDARGWRMMAYRRIRRAAGAIDSTARPTVRPAALVPPVTDAAVVERHRASLLFAERAFARESQIIGLQAGFATFGDPRAINLGGPATAGFTVGNTAIAALVSDGSTEARSPVDWWPERALVASSGDLGITFGYITPNGAAAAGQAKPRIPFFTIWHRASPDAPWRYVAE